MFAVGLLYVKKKFTMEKKKLRKNLVFRDAIQIVNKAIYYIVMSLWHEHYPKFVESS